MNTDEVKRDIIEQEKKYWKAMMNQDLESCVGLTDFPCLIAGSSGVRYVDQVSFEQMFNSHREKLKDFDFDGTPEVRVLGEDTAVVAYQTNSIYEEDGKQRKVDAVDTSTWVKRNGKWVCAAHAEFEKVKH